MDPLAILIDTLVTGLPLVPAFAGIWLVMRMRDDFDLTIDGSFTLGGAVTATMLVAGVPIVVAMLAGVVAGLGAGLVTATLHLTLGIPVILAGLVMSLALFSINLRVMGMPSVSLASVDTMFTPLTTLGGSGLGGHGADVAVIGAIVVICALVLGGLVAFLRTEVGIGLRATGRNPLMARSNGVNERRMLVLNLAAANALTALSGTLVVQNQGFADVNMGTGTLIAGAGAVLLGELLLRPTGVGGRPCDRRHRGGRRRLSHGAGGGTAGRHARQRPEAGHGSDPDPRLRRTGRRTSAGTCPGLAAQARRGWLPAPRGGTGPCLTPDLSRHLQPQGSPPCSNSSA